MAPMRLVLIINLIDSNVKYIHIDQTNLTLAIAAVNGSLQTLWSFNETKILTQLKRTTTNSPNVNLFLLDNWSYIHTFNRDLKMGTQLSHTVCVEANCIS